MNKKTQGKRNLEAGRRFENKVRKDLENKGWIVSRWCNNVELTMYVKQPEVDYKEKKDRVEVTVTEFEAFKGKLIPAKQGKFRKTSTGFPDFIAFIDGTFFKTGKREGLYEVIGVECKSNGYLTKEEKEKCKWLLKNQVFSKILIASKGKKRGTIKYQEVK